MDQRNKGIEPPFFINNTRGQPTSREPKRVETWCQRTRNPLIQCWGCKGDHMFKYCPHRGEKLRIVHSVQQAKTTKDMGINVPRIYAALDNKQIKYQSHMIEVEDKVPNLKDHAVLKGFEDVFKEEPGLPPKIDIDFSINLMPREAPMSKTPYRTSTPELEELQM
jgi:hypothetical protein